VRGTFGVTFLGDRVSLEVEEERVRKEANKRGTDECLR